METTVNHVTMTRARLRPGSAVYARPRDLQVTNPCNRRHIKSLIHNHTMGKIQQIKIPLYYRQRGSECVCVWGGGGGEEGAEETDRQIDRDSDR